MSGNTIKRACLTCSSFRAFDGDADDVDEQIEKWEEEHEQKRQERLGAEAFGRAEACVFEDVR